jgi:predicted Fe-Mo cluster-binding NifX family protein
MAAIITGMSETASVALAIPVVEGRLAAHFAEARQFALVNVDLSDGKNHRAKIVAAPPHEPGSLPRWLREQQVQAVIVSAIGRRALDNFLHHGMEVRTGQAGAPVASLVADFAGRNLPPALDGCIRQQGGATRVHDCRLAGYLKE